MNELAWIDETVSALTFRRLEGFPWSPPTREDFERFAATVGAPLPPDYQYFLTKYGGVILGDEDCSVKVLIAQPSPRGQRTGPEMFYPLLRDHGYSLEGQVSTYQDRLPSGVLPIADDAGGNQICLDVTGAFPGSVWFWDHEQRWFKGNIQETSEELEAAGISTNRLSVHGILREWARLHPERFDPPADYMGMYRIAPSFSEFLRALHRVPY